MSDSQQAKSPQRLHPLGALGLVLLAVSLIVWLWTGEWRWTVTALIVLFALAAVGAALDSRRKRHADPQ